MPSKSADNASTSADYFDEPMEEHGLNRLKMNERFSIDLSKNWKNSITNEEMRRCRTINFSLEWTNGEILSEISNFDAKTFKNLFIFNMKQDEETDCEQILDAARKFCKRRPLIIHFGTRRENKSRTFYVDEKSDEWIDILREKEEKVDQVQNFSDFSQWIAEIKIKNADMLVTEVCKVLSNPDRLTLRFLSTLKMNSKSYFHLLSHCAANYSKSQFLAALGISFGSDERFLDEYQSHFISNKFTKQNKSILESAIANKNGQVLKYLIWYCSHLIHQLPSDHQQKIVKELIEQQNLETFCDLLEFCDFQFPTDIMKSQEISHERLQQIITKRKNFHKAIVNENYSEIEKFIEGSSLKLAQNVQNQTAMYTALSARKFEVYYHLMSLGFKGKDCNKLEKKLKRKKKLEFSQMKTAKANAMKRNCGESETYENMAIYLLTARSKIFGKSSREVRKKIKFWFKSINDILFGSLLLNAVSQSTRLNIIFDFESENVERVDLDSPDADGIMYPRKHLVIIAAKHSTLEQEEAIKGVLAHELWHYAMKIVFENDEQPYLNEYDVRFTEYRRIVEKLKYEFLVEKRNDGCNGIISIVFEYKEEEFDAELIVRPIQILAQYSNDKLKVEQLMNRYENLFNFVEKRLTLPIKELDLRKREDVRSFNKLAGLFPSLSKNKIEFRHSREIEQVLENKLIVARSNVPKMLLAQIYSHLEIKNGSLLSGMAVFISSEGFESVKIEFSEHLREFEDLTFILDISSNNSKVLKTILNASSKNNFIIITNRSELLEINKYKRSNPITFNMNYEWRNLTKNARTKLLKTEVNFQNNPNVTLGELLESPQDVINEEVLNEIFKKTKLSINANKNEEKNEKKDDFDGIFRQRRFIWKNQTISLEELLEKTRNGKFVLISDVAGTGKSWAMRKISKELIRLYPTKWLTFVDLKQFIPIFKGLKHQEQQPNFEDFITKVILKEKSKLEIDVFKMKYRNGNAFIFLDAFDEIAPDCAETVQELMKSFESNGNNQLWIATRSLFEDELCEKLNGPLHHTFTCKLAEFTVDDGIDLISIIWKLNDLRKQNENVDFKENGVGQLLNENGENESKYIKRENYKQDAREFCLKMPTNDLDGIGQPLIYKMLANVAKENELKFKNKKYWHYRLFNEFCETSYKQWKNQGEIRESINAKSQQYDLTFHKLHQLKAMQKIMPERKNYCDLNVNSEKKWSDVHLVGCGLMTKSGENYFFIHETFGEFFAAQFILRNLDNRNARIFEFIEEIVTNPKHEVIRMFLNEALAFEEESEESEESHKNCKAMARIVATKAEEIKNPYEIFTKNLRYFDELGTFWFMILKYWNYEKLVDNLTENVRDLILEHEGRVNESLQKIFVELFTCSVDILTIKAVTTKLTALIRPQIIQEALNFKNRLGENIFFVLVKTKTLDQETFQKFTNVMKEFLSQNEIDEKMMMCRSSGESVLHYCIRHGNIQSLKVFWEGFEKSLDAESFKDILNKETIGPRYTVIHYAALYSKSINLHETLWNLLQNTLVNDKNDFYSRASRQNLRNYNFIYLMIENNSSDVLDWTLNKVEGIFSRDEVREILKMKGFEDINLLQYAAKCSKQLKTHQVLWNFLSKYFDSNELLEFFSEIDIYGESLLHYLARNSTSEILDFMLEQLDKFTNTKKVREIILSGENLLSFAATYNKDLDFHESLWKLAQTFLDESDVSLLIHSVDNGYNLLQAAIKWNTKEIVELTWMKVKMFLSEEERAKYLRKKNGEGLSLRGIATKYNEYNVINF